MDRSASSDLIPGMTSVRDWLSSRASRVDRPLRVFLVGLILWTVVASSLRRAFVGDFVDDGHYLVAARSLCDGHGYRLPSRVGNPVATKYPVGTSAIAAIAMTLLPGSQSTRHDWIAGRVVVLLAGLGLAETSRRFFLGSGLTRWSSSLFALALIWYPGVFLLTSTLMSDLIFAFLTLLVLVRWLARARSDEVSAFPWFIDGLLIGLAVMVRSNGLTLVCSSLVASFLTNRGRYRKQAALVVGIGLLWMTSTILVRSQTGPRDSGNYALELSAAYGIADHFWSIPLTNLSRIPSVLTSLIISPMTWNWRISTRLADWTIIRGVVELSAVPAIILGALFLWRRRVWPFSVWVNASLTLLLFMIWHSPFDFRFALPLNALILSMFAAGLSVIDRQAAYLPLVASIVLAVSLVTVAETAWRAYRAQGIMGGGQSLQEVSLFEIIRTQVPLDAILICGLPEMVYLNTGRIAAPLREDDLYFSDRPPEWKRIKAWLAVDPGRPVYLLDNPGGSGKGVMRWAPFLVRENRLHLTMVPGTNNRLWRLNSAAETV